MKPIISPWLIYFLSVLDGINTIGAVIFWLGLFGIPLTFVFGAVLECWKSAEHGLKALKPYAIAYAIFVMVSLFIPNKTTVYQMIVAKELTPDNISTITRVAGDTAEDVADYVVDVITRVSEAVKDNA